MIVVSLLLIGVAVVLLVLGLWQPSSALLTGSIGASVLAAVVLVIGARRASAARVAEAAHARHASRASRQQPVELDEPAAESEHPHTAGFPTQQLSLEQVRTAVAGPAPGDGAAGESAGAGGSAGPAIPQQGAGTSVLDSYPAEDDSPDGYADHPDPPDEPAPQQVSAADAARVGRMGTEVLVVDGRPRYHLPGCVHLLGRESEPLPVSEAIELGFTPCSLCEPDSALLADARRV